MNDARKKAEKEAGTDARGQLKRFDKNGNGVLDPDEMPSA